MQFIEDSDSLMISSIPNVKRAEFADGAEYPYSVCKDVLYRYANWQHPRARGIMRGSSGLRPLLLDQAESVRLVSELAKKQCRRAAARRRARLPRLEDDLCLVESWGSNRID